MRALALTKNASFMHRLWYRIQPKQCFNVAWRAADKQKWRHVLAMADARRVSWRCPSLVSMAREKALASRRLIRRHHTLASRYWCEVEMSDGHAIATRRKISNGFSSPHGNSIGCPWLRAFLLEKQAEIARMAVRRHCRTCSASLLSSLIALKQGYADDCALSAFKWRIPQLRLYDNHLRQFHCWLSWKILSYLMSR